MKMRRSKRNVKIIFPSTITTFAMVFGFIAILLAAGGQFHKACYLVMLALVMDGLDGKVARYTNTASEFGIQYDSLSDLIAFGAAPGVIYYHFYLKGQGADQVYYLLPIMFLVCGAVRLARFNVTASIYGKTHFTGMPIPAAAFMMVTIPLFYMWSSEYPLFQSWGWGAYLTRENFFHLSVVITVILSLSMISTWKFDTPGSFFFRRYAVKNVNYLVLIALFSTMLISYAMFAMVLSLYYLIAMLGRALIARLKGIQPPALDPAASGPENQP